MAKKQPTDTKEPEASTPSKEEEKVTKEESQTFHPNQIPNKQEVPE